ncbi:unnamed protein product [Pocillopora meandrina]|uniref:LicD/FKTN/FKRP nucleotidyltransferase domain-containing protein n=1 Tax=Pocillopora meandrina TaxID=46732 RepID=A0AAU9XSH7_9CNID|nr:unnamed protein product [Pocillopora meandrina]
MLANRLLIISSVIVLLVLISLHLVILPSVSGGYNEECYLPLKRRQTLRMMVKNISRVFDKYGVKYWLDYGTLLGAYRMGDILSYDHDADISYILETEKPEAFRKLRELGMQANGLVVALGDVTVDFMRWQPVNVSNYISGKTETMLRKYYPPSSKDNLILKYHHTLETSPMSWVVPFKRFYFQDVNIALPNSPDKLLAFRYPYTFGARGFQFPYKC